MGEVQELQGLVFKAQFLCPGEVGVSFVLVPFHFMRLAPVVVGPGIRRVKLDHPGVISNRLVVLFLDFIRLSPLGVRIRIGRLSSIALV